MPALSMRPSASADDPEEGEEGELEDAPEAPQSLTPLVHDALVHGAEAMEVDTNAAEQGMTPLIELHC